MCAGLAYPSGASRAYTTLVVVAQAELVLFVGFLLFGYHCVLFLVYPKNRLLQNINITLSGYFIFLFNEAFFEGITSYC